ncbi:hypothetical protein HYQ45_004501 [Verticillium longisporum]|uniref:Uncharacterized protein n=1 Tax=Verticillium longisporum TaxID=100787 RepID=A0A8I2ZUQ3_VERLO|nr:hypothetical protein HYQ45_004501 [Verticillium longisporum]RBQ69842.1 hypothetical protein VDGD_21538 [Verticillium dahliae]
MPSASSTSKRFELPQLNFNFASLTEGTNIPPPPDSPVKEVPTPPQTPPVDAKQGESKQIKPIDTAAAAAAASPGTTAIAEGETQSNGHANGNGHASAVPARPMSRSNGSIFDEKKAKRGSGFFRRLRTSESPVTAKRSPSVYEQPNNSQSRPEIRGPPPPMIPELSALESKVDVNDGGSLGSDLFKNIK